VNALRCIDSGKKTKTAPSLWDFVTLPEDRAKAIGNMHRIKKPRKGADSHRRQHARFVAAYLQSQSQVVASASAEIFGTSFREV